MSQTASPDELINLALPLHESGKFREAEALYRQALAKNPAHPHALHLLGVLAHQHEQNEAALDLILRAIAHNPKDPAYYSNLGEVYRSLRMTDAALGAYRQALAINPDFPESLSNMGNLLCELKRYEEAEQACLRAIAVKPDMHQAWNNLGNAYEERRFYDKAEECYRKSVEIDPKFSKGYSNLGIALQHRGCMDESIRAYDQAIACEPNFNDAHWNASLALLMLGEFKRGWQEYEWRWKSKDFPSPIRTFTQPLWGGEDLTGKTIVLHAEQGYGDAIQFARYVSLTAKRGARVLVECQPELVTLFQTLEGASEVFERFAPLPPFDYHAPFLSLPRAFGTMLETIPANVPYLKAVPEKVAHYRKLLDGALPAKAKAEGYLKIGLVWAGSPTHKDDRNRSLPLVDLAPLFKIRGVTFVNLQIGAAVNQILSSGLPVTDVTDDIKDFADTAALVENLDLVISVDTSVVHVAGGLGKPIWTLITRVPDWRWLLNRGDSPWYPSLRLFRRNVDDWKQTIQELTAALAEHVANRH